MYFFVRQGWLSKIFFMYLYCNEYMNLHNYGQSAQHTSKLNGTNVNDVAVALIGEKTPPVSPEVSPEW